MSALHDLPRWFQFAWGGCSIAMMIAAYVWAIFVLWPYIRLTRRLMLQSLEIGKETVGLMKELRKQIEDGWKNEAKPVWEDTKTLVKDARAHLDRVSKKPEKTVRLPHEGTVEADAGADRDRVLD